MRYSSINFQPLRHDVCDVGGADCDHTTWLVAGDQSGPTAFRTLGENTVVGAGAVVVRDLAGKCGCRGQPGTCDPHVHREWLIRRSAARISASRGPLGDERGRYDPGPSLAANLTALAITASTTPAMYLSVLYVQDVLGARRPPDGRRCSSQP